jgi:hypothetical protein
MSLECPNCRESVSFFRALRTTAWTSFRCKACGSVLGISFGRRMLAGGIWLAFLLLSVRVLELYTLGRLVFYTSMAVSFIVIFYLCERIFLLDRRAFTCKECGYDLHGLTEPRCPECGHAFDPAERQRILERIESPPPRTRYRWIALLVVVFLTLTVVAGLVAWRRGARAAAGRAAPTAIPSNAPAAPASQ